MDARLDPAKFSGLAEGDATSSATPASAPAEDAIRSLVISYKLFGTREWFIIHHTDCGMELFTNETMPELLEKSLETARLEEVKEETQVGAASDS
jgi:carbonic anhydrase